MWVPSVNPYKKGGLQNKESMRWYFPFINPNDFTINVLIYTFFISLEISVKLCYIDKQPESRI